MNVDSALNKLGRSINELERIIEKSYIFRTTEEISKFARSELDMVDRDEVATIAVQELHMTPEREEDP